MDRIIIYPYKMGSASAQALQSNLKQEVGHTNRIIRVWPDGTFRKRPSDLVINWGSSRVANWGTPTLNSYEAVARASNKLATFRALDETLIPTWTEHKSVAQHWITDGIKVFARTTLTGHSGQGIIICTNEIPEAEIVDAPLYSLAFDKTREYRVHVWQGEVLDVQEKRKRSGTGTRSDCDVWNHGNDFVFARENIETPSCVTNAAIQAVSQLGLDFGAVDLGYNHRNDTCVVFEVNTAPGLSGTTLDKYVEKIVCLL